MAWAVASSCDGGPTANNGFSPLWRYPSLGLFQGKPGADDEVVVIAVKDSVIALDQSTGEPRWKVVPGVEIQTAELPIVDGVLYLINTAVFAYDVSDGSEIWRTELPRPGFFFGGTGVAVGRTRVYAARRGGEVFAFDRQTGALLWETILQPQPTEMIEVDFMLCVPSNSLVFRGVPQGAITCLDGATGEMVWRFEIPELETVDENGVPICDDGGVSAQPAVAGDKLLFGEQCGRLYALEIATGEVSWMVPTNSPFDTSVVVSGETAYVCARAPACIAFRVEDGTILWTTDVGGSVVRDPALDGNDLYVVALGGTLFRIDASTGAIRGRLRSTDDGLGFARSPIVRNGLVFTGGDTYYALNPP